MCEDAISELFDQDLYRELREQENEERQVYRIRLREFISDL